MMSSFASNVSMPQFVPGHPFGGPHNQPNYPAFARHGAPGPAPALAAPYSHPSHPAEPPRFLGADSAFLPPPPPPRGPNMNWYAQHQQHMIPRDVLEQRARTPCKHFNHHLGWCPYGAECHFLHDFSRIPSRGPSASSSPVSSVVSSVRSSPIPSGPFYPPRSTPFQPAFAAAPPPHRAPRVLHHDFVPCTIGGTTYFPIRLDEARLGYVTPSGVEVFTDH